MISIHGDDRVAVADRRMNVRAGDSEKVQIDLVGTVVAAAPQDVVDWN
jgi:hypothetical protein